MSTSYSVHHNLPTRHVLEVNVCNYVGRFRDREDRSWSVQLKHINKFCTMHISFHIRFALKLHFCDIEEENADGLFQSILTNFVQCILSFHIRFPHTVNVVQMKSRKWGSIYSYMQLMQLSLLNERMSFLDVGSVVLGRVDGIVAFMWTRNVLVRAENCAK